jgi:hypothetical protein
MGLQNFLAKSLERGEKMKAHLINHVLHSAIVNQLLKNEKFLNGVATVLNAKSGVENKVHRRVNCFLKYFEIPTREEIQNIERKIHRLENEMEGVHRRVLTQSLRKTSHRVSPLHKKH